MRWWYIVFEAYQLDNVFYVKEIAILSNGLEHCHVYYTKCPKEVYMPCDATIRYQRRKHQISWNYGVDIFKQAMRDIIAKIGFKEPVYCKGEEKLKFLRMHLPQIQPVLPEVSGFSRLNKAPAEVCFLKHGNHCARKKVHELLFAEREILGRHTTATTDKVVTWEDDTVFHEDQLSQPDKRDVLPPISTE